MEELRGRTGAQVFETVFMRIIGLEEE
jgi:hypothetical protein